MSFDSSEIHKFKNSRKRSQRTQKGPRIDTNGRERRDEPQMNADLVLSFDDGFDPKGYFTASGILRSLKIGSSTSLPSLRIILICV